MLKFHRPNGDPLWVNPLRVDSVEMAPNVKHTVLAIGVRHLFVVGDADMVAAVIREAQLKSLRALGDVVEQLKKIAPYERAAR